MGEPLHPARHDDLDKVQEAVAKIERDIAPLRTCQTYWEWVRSHVLRAVAYFGGLGAVGLGVLWALSFLRPEAPWEANAKQIASNEATASKARTENQDSFKAIGVDLQKAATLANTNTAAITNLTTRLDGIATDLDRVSKQIDANSKQMTNQLVITGQHQVQIENLAKAVETTRASMVEFTSQSKQSIIALDRIVAAGVPAQRSAATTIHSAIGKHNNSGGFKFTVKSDAIPLTQVLTTEAWIDGPLPAALRGHTIQFIARFQDERNCMVELVTDHPKELDEFLQKETLPVVVRATLRP